jgi:hypothetical protein
MDEELITPEATQIVDQQMPVTEQPQLTQEQVVAQTMDQQRLDNYNSKGYSIKNWIDNDYDYNPADIGNLWVAGAISDSNTQMSFLEATLNEDMYSEQDIGKYYFDQNLAIARAYAKEKKHETMYGYYKAAQERALAEADLTGWYMPPEAAYMLSQWVTAEENLKNPSINDIDRARAESVVRASESWFAANNITRQGIETLSHMYLEETIRHNREVEALYDLEVEIEKLKTANAQAQANQTAREVDYEIRFRELGSGMDLNDDGLIGFGGSEWEGRFASYDDMKEWAIDHPMTAQTIMGTSGLQVLFGDRYEEDFLNVYNKELHTQKIDHAASNNNGVLETGNVPATGAKISSSSKKYGDYTDKNIYYVIYDNEIRYYVNKGTEDNKLFVQITDMEDITLQDGSSLDRFKTFDFSGEALKTRDGSFVNVGSNVDYSKMKGSVTNNKDLYPGMSDKEYKTISKYESEGYRLAPGLIDTTNKNSTYVLVKENSDGSKEYIAIHKDGVAKKVTNMDNLLQIKYEGKNKGYSVTRVNGTEPTNWQKTYANSYANELENSQGILIEDKNGNKRFILQDSTGQFNVTDIDSNLSQGYATDEEKGAWFAVSDTDRAVNETDKLYGYKDYSINDLLQDSEDYNNGVFNDPDNMGSTNKKVEETRDTKRKPSGRSNANIYYNQKYKYTNREILDYEKNGKIKEEEDKKKGDKR